MTNHYLQDTLTTSMRQKQRKRKTDWQRKQGDRKIGKNGNMRRKS
jgi:hypothetical protein